MFADTDNVMQKQQQKKRQNHNDCIEILSDEWSQWWNRTFRSDYANALTKLFPSLFDDEALSHRFSCAFPNAKYRWMGAVQQFHW